MKSFPVFLALTRQPTFMGVTQSAFVANSMASMVLFLVSKHLLVSGIIFFMLHGLGVMLCRRDEQGIEILLGYIIITYFTGRQTYDPS